MDTKDFHDVTPKQIATLKDRIRAKGIGVPDGDDATFYHHQHKMNMHFKYDGASVLRVEVEKGWWPPTSAVWNEIAKELESAK